MNRPKLLRVTTVPVSLKVLLKGQHCFMSGKGIQVIGISSSGTELEDVSHDEHIRTICLEMTRTISPLKDLISLWKFYQLCRTEKPDMVHSHTPKAGIVGMLGARLAGVPLRLHTVAGLPLMEAKGIKRKILDMVEKLTYASATHVYPNSKGLYDFIVMHHLTRPGKMKVIGNGSSNGIDTSFFSPSAVRGQETENLKRLLGICPEDFVFVFVGRLVGDKGINELITAFAEIVKEKKDVRLLLVGPTEADLDPLQEETLQEIEHNPDIISVGFQKDVRPYFAISDCLVFPSYREGFPNVVMQAGAMGLPAVVSDINGCNEIVIDGKNGRIVPPKNTRQLKQVMLEMMEDRILFQHLKSHARPMIQSRYEQSIVWNALLDEYRKLLNMQKS
ncbi:glycosyltransferase family 4 protein [Daejeonia sp. YH14]|uniref:glycosyltransferase family 4 protein n=1 Tax=Daejeonia sp. YH14 TaxID=3439042 RepID=UPI003F490F50